MVEIDPAAGMQMKDWLTLLISGAAFLTSLSVAIFNVQTDARRRRADARSEFAGAIRELAEVRRDYAELRNQLGPDFANPDFSARRGSLSDLREFYLQKAVTLVRTGMVKGTSAERILIAATLMERGRTEEATGHYQAAYELAGDDYSKNSVRRVYGRALAIGGRYAEGRQLMIDAAHFYESAAKEKRYGQQLYMEAADTWRRLVDVALIARETDHLADDFGQFERVIPLVAAADDRELQTRFAGQMRQPVLSALAGRVTT